MSPTICQFSWLAYGQTTIEPPSPQILSGLRRPFFTIRNGKVLSQRFRSHQITQFIQVGECDVKTTNWQLPKRPQYIFKIRIEFWSRQDYLLAEVYIAPRLPRRRRLPGASDSLPGQYLVYAFTGMTEAHNRKLKLASLKRCKSPRDLTMGAVW
jgi:hypothetical protein